MTTIITAAALASELGTDGRTVRKFLRSITPREDQPGKGSRWGIKGTKTEIARLRKAFTAYETAQEAARAKREEAKAAEAEVTADAPADADLEPTDAELLAIEESND